ncbi:MAG: hypothetical protein ACRDAG_00400 [Cetobacterium somerae]|uniref:Uncharacterized protein n=2 Tax=Cetobacterium TaxID=180162 RepID=U7VFX3_9FUSO|nr:MULTISPECIES: hypothetical protein [Cetobacterium]ERT69678.1 hypothetical protein HMPREF0202_00369 [Cetobacterium somerae ATCC BAA-474]MBC2853390.1 hypothetical protein [Cetobacterium sp. 2G large]MCQ9625810.1 hypothetical protein [Cetobacterium somerae]WVJ01555.1 hypothetical protein VSU16_02210 [Cetobacterium somerae]
MKNRIEKRVAKVIENADTLDKRAYLTIDCDGVVKRKEMNFSIPLMVFCENDEIFERVLKEESNKIERIKEKKIERLSNVPVDKLKENFMKLVIKGELEFSKKYGKELALKDKEEFLKTLFNLSLMDNINFYKPLMALAMKEIIENIGWVDEIGYLVISYFTKQRYDLSQLENAIENESEITEISENISLLAYKKVLESYTYKNEKKYRAMLLSGVKNQNRLTQWQIDDEILNSIKF